MFVFGNTTYIFPTMLFKYKDLNNQEQSIELPITVDKFIAIKTKVNGLELLSMQYYWVFWEIRDALFKRLMFDCHKQELTTFLKQLQTNDFDFKEHYQDTIVKAVDIYYNVYYWDSVFVAGEPSTTVFEDGILGGQGRLELHLDFDTEALEHLLVQLLEAFGIIGIEEHQEEDALATSELSADGLFEDFVSECWLNLKEQTKSKVIGILFQATGCGSMSDLDTGENVDESTEGMAAYLKRKGAF